jgi:hypothetical protein
MALSLSCHAKLWQVGAPQTERGPSLEKTVAGMEIDSGHGYH